MKKKSQNENDVVAVMNKIQAQLAVLDRKLDAFMTKSLTELAQARAAAKPIVHTVQVPVGGSPRPQERLNTRPMYAVVCFDCGKDTEIPFKPSGDRPVYCQECFSRRKAGKVLRAPTDQKPQAPSLVQTAKPAMANVPEAPAKTKKKPAAKKKVAVKKKEVRKRK